MVLVAQDRDLLGDMALYGGPPEEVVVLEEGKATDDAAEPATPPNLALHGVRDVPGGWSIILARHVGASLNLPSGWRNVDPRGPVARAG